MYIFIVCLIMKYYKASDRSQTVSDYFVLK